ncbi:DUF3459 domain-containing protein [Gluconobacter oxydans]|uniref:DUF3459 domain-containing protein n=1 Tax=Gluconobacter oxydans TaxID=442 RepID=UPI003464B7F0
MHGRLLKPPGQRELPRDTEGGRAWLALTRQLLALRREWIIPYLHNVQSAGGMYWVMAHCRLRWRLNSKKILFIFINLSGKNNTIYQKDIIFFMKRLRIDGVGLITCIFTGCLCRGRAMTLSLRATYRIQFHKDYTLYDAISLVPYLKKLGISHIYASPLLASASGSLHGYDTISWDFIDPERGGKRDYRLSSKCYASTIWALFWISCPII